ncbi:hypothetical protein EJ06DRAFT_19939 [Trichodelitschia bisporula]|uniref:Uncharacterized protein n=1 Tax=Trichodelitschia bisporula TaxID=703511 RepID=A0A6G1IAF8_9PEZI|nr:hypothetical protein EJ06DRAFT_19939 [Trichodelitschia bisporula]
MAMCTSFESRRERNRMRSSFFNHINLQPSTRSHGMIHANSQISVVARRLTLPLTSYTKCFRPPPAGGMVPEVVSLFQLEFGSVYLYLLLKGQMSLLTPESHRGCRVQILVSGRQKVGLPNTCSIRILPKSSDWSWNSRLWRNAAPRFLLNCSALQNGCCGD